MKYAVIDIGSNTIRLSFFMQMVGGSVNEFLNKKSTAGLQSYVINGYLNQKGVNKLVKVLKKFISIANSIDVYDVKIFATASLRNIENRDEVLQYVNKSIDCEIDLISGTEEALFGYLGARQEYDIKDGVLIDIGGGSTEITKIEKESPQFENSIPIGSLNLYTKFCRQIIPRKKEIEIIEKYVDKAIKKVNFKSKADVLYGTGGTVRAVGNVCQEMNQLQSEKEIAFEFIKNLLKKIKNKDIRAIKTILQVAPDRIHTITTGLIILVKIMEKSNAKKLYVSKNGVREGYLINYLKESKHVD